MKRSTIYLIILVVVIFITPFVFLGILISKNPDLYDVFVTEVKDVQYSYKLVIQARDGGVGNGGHVLLTTYRGYVDEEAPVNFVTDGSGFSTSQQGDTIVIVIDSLRETGEEGHFLTVEFPKETGLELVNTDSRTEVRIESGDFRSLRLQSCGKTGIHSCNISDAVLSDTIYANSIFLSDDNVGRLRINGNVESLQIEGSNIGFLFVGGSCHRISLEKNNIGACSWSWENRQLADINDCVIGSTKIEADTTGGDAVWDDASLTVFEASSNDSSKIQFGIRVNVDGKTLRPDDVSE